MKNIDEIQVGDLISRYSDVFKKTCLGVVTKIDGIKVYALWSNDSQTRALWAYIYDIVGNWKVINFEEENKMNEKVVKGNTGLGTTRVKTIEDSLSVAQEAMNNAYMAINGILQAHAEKNGEEVSPIETVFTFDDFDKSVSRTWKKQDFKDAISNAALGLTGEAGEVADLIKKAVYHGRGWKDYNGIMYSECPTANSINPLDVKDELSDVLFYVSAMAQEFGFTLEDIAHHNKEKLEKRYKEGFTTEESANKADKLVKISENRETGESYYV